jgi:hypothetical protein
VFECIYFTWCKKKESADPNLTPSIEESVSDNIQVDPSFKTQKCYLKITAQYVYKELLLKRGYSVGDFCVKTIGNILNRLGYTLKKVLKTKPLKKIPETDAIFENVARQHAIAKSNPRILRISIDTKAKVKIGNLSRDGYSRQLEAPEADDHDLKWESTLVPFGIYEITTENVFILFGQSAETSDFIVDALEKWWLMRQFEENDYDLLMIDLDNGPSVAAQTRQMMNRMVGFAKLINMPIQLVYYPPYHSKYNPVERFWAALENYWNPFILDTVKKTIQIAKQMTWNGMNPIVDLMTQKYEKGVKVEDKNFDLLEPFILRNPLLPKWDVKILYYPNG